MDRCHPWEKEGNQYNNMRRISARIAGEAEWRSFFSVAVQLSNLLVGQILLFTPGPGDSKEDSHTIQTTDAKNFTLTGGQRAY
jgi:hypothetical protein